MRLKLIACEIFFRELCHLVSRSPNICDIEFLPKGLHDLGSDKMAPRIQERIDAVDAERYDAIILGYGLCNNGIIGLHAGDLRMVVPRSHDCIGLFMGDRCKYREYFDAHPGTYYRTTGWTERDDASGAGDETVPQQLGLFMDYASLVEKYGEENAKYVMETMGYDSAHYDRMTYINMGLSCEESFRDRAQQEAAEKGWQFDELQGSMKVLRKLVDGEWDDDFLVLEPGEVIAARYDDDVIQVQNDEKRSKRSD